MIFGATPFASIPFSSVVVDYALASPFSALIANQDADRAYLIDCRPYDPINLTEVQVGFSVGLKRPILAGRAWPARIGTVVNSQVDLFGDDIGRGGSSSFGVIELLIGDGDHDDILNYAWDGRQVNVLMGAEGFDYSLFEPVFVGTAADIEYNDRKLSIILRDKSELLNRDIQENLYAGSGGLEGGDDIANVAKHLCYGTVKNITPVLIDRANIIYQWHDGPVQAVDGAFDGALALGFAGDVADILTASVSPGQYITQNSGGYIKLGAEPERAFTVDGRGDNAGGYVDTVADIVARIIQNHTDLTVSDLELQSFSAVNTANSAAVGWYGNAGTVAETISQLMGSIGGSWVFNRNGRVVVGVFQFGSSVGQVASQDVVSLQRLRTPVPTWRRQLGYARSWLVQSQSDINAAAASGTRKDFVSREYRFAIDEDTNIKTRRILARSAEINTLLENANAAATEAARQQSIFGADRSIYRIVTRRQQFKYRPGQTITIRYPRFGFPKDVIILGIVENTNNRYTEFRVYA